VRALEVAEVLTLADEHVREGRFQRSLALLTALSCIPAGLEVSYEHYRGSYGQAIMYTPVVLSGALAAAGIAGFFNKTAAQRVMRWTGYITLADCLTGFGFHIRGIYRKPGNWRVPVINMVMGPPIFAPLLFGVSAYLAVVASYLRREDEHEWLPKAARRDHWRHQLPGTGRHERINWSQDLREGRFQKHMAAATAASAFFSGFEAWYSHYKNRFQYKVQWTPLIVSPLLMLAALMTMKSRWAGHRLLPAVSAVAVANGAVGFAYHARGVLRRPGGLKLPLYNVMYGPPIFAPLLFAACGALGLLASLLRREPDTRNNRRHTVSR
jgi:hypothetical protein